MKSRIIKNTNLMSDSSFRLSFFRIDTSKFNFFFSLACWLLYCSVKSLVNWSRNSYILAFSASSLLWSSWIELCLSLQSNLYLIISSSSFFFSFLRSKSCRLKSSSCSTNAKSERDPSRPNEPPLPRELLSLELMLALRERLGPGTVR